MSTHILEIAEKICTRVGVIISGRSIFEDSTENVKAGLIGEDGFAKLLNELTSNTILENK